MFMVVLSSIYCSLGTPEVAGLTPVQAIEIVRGLRGLNIVGGDLVEVRTSYIISYQDGFSRCFKNVDNFTLMNIFPKVFLCDFR